MKLKALFFFLLSTLCAGAVEPILQTSYLKASNGGDSDHYGEAVDLDRDTLVVGAMFENGSGKGVNPPHDDNLSLAGAAYVFVRDGALWTQQAYLKASNPGQTALFGTAVGVDGDYIVIGANGENSNTSGVNSMPNESGDNVGAAYVFKRTGSAWKQEAYLKASNPGDFAFFGFSVAISGDTIVVGAGGENSGTTGVNSVPNTAAAGAGAAYVFVRSGTTWTQQAYLKASNTNAGDGFGREVAISGNTIAIGATGERSNATGINGNQADNSVEGAGAVYIFTRSSGVWTQQAYIKASNTGSINDLFGDTVSIDGDTLLVGAAGEDSSSPGVNPPTNESATDSGAAYVFTRTGSTWTQQALIKPSVVGAGDRFGSSVDLSQDALVIGALGEDGGSTGVNGDATSNSLTGSGAAYYFTRDGVNWTQAAYVKAFNADEDDQFGESVTLDEGSFVVGATGEDGSGRGNNPDVTEIAPSSGAVYSFEVLPVVAGLAHSNYRAPGGTDLFHGKLGASAIDPNGSLMFDSALTGSGAPAAKNQAVFSNLAVSPALQLCLQKGEPVNNLGNMPANAKIASVKLPMANLPSLGLFQATVSGTGMNPASNWLLYRDDGVNVVPLLRTGGTAIGFLSNATFKSIFEITQDPIHDLIGVAYVLNGGSPAVTPATDSGVLFMDHNANALIVTAREGENAYGGGGKFGQFTPRTSLGILTNPLFIAKFIPTGGMPRDAWFDNLLRFGSVQGDDAPVLAGAEKMGTYLSTVGGATVAYLRASLTGTTTAENEIVYRSDFVPMLRKGQTLTPLPEKVAKIVRMWAVGADQLVFHLELSGPGVTGKNKTALVLRLANGDYQILARTGTPAPGYPPGVTLSAFSAVDVEQFNGHYVLLATLAGTTAKNNQALFHGQAGLTTDTLRLPKRVLRKGQLYSSVLTPLGSVKSIALSVAPESSGAGARGLRQVINASGQIVLTILGDLGTTELVKLDTE